MSGSTTRQLKSHLTETLKILYITIDSEGQILLHFQSVTGTLFQPPSRPTDPPVWNRTLPLATHKLICSLGKHEVTSRTPKTL